MDRFALFNDVKQRVKAYRDFLEKNKAGNIQQWEDIPITTKHDYLLKYPVEDTVREGEMDKCFLIGASSGFSKTGTVYWLKGAIDENRYIHTVEESLKNIYGIDKKKTLTIVALAFGTWIGGMQLACTMRSLGAKTDYPFTVATVGLDLEEGASIIKRFKHLFDQVLFITNASNVSIVYSLFKEEKELLNGFVYFPVVGEYFSEHYRRDMAIKFGHPEDEPFVLWTGYGSADTGDVAIETKATIMLRKELAFKNKQLALKLFGTEEVPMIMAIADNAYVEIVDGNIVVTKDQLIPLIRYNTKDLGTIINKKQLIGSIDEKLYESLPDEMLCIANRTDNSIIFYGTNLFIPEIGNFLYSIGDEISYSGLFEVEKKLVNGIETFRFTVYTFEEKMDKNEFCQKKLIEFLKSNSKEFKAKYDNLTKAAGMNLVNVELKKLDKSKTSKKHRFIKE